MEWEGLFGCDGHVTNPAGVSPVAGIYRQA